jgi:hypothetical protein
MLAWQSNYIHFNLRRRTRYSHESAMAQIYWLALLARGISAFIDENLIKGNPRNERLCRWALANIRYYADFSKLQTGKSQYLAQIKAAQMRLDGLNLHAEKIF